MKHFKAVSKAPRAAQEFGLSVILDAITQLFDLILQFQISKPWGVWIPPGTGGTGGTVDTGGTGGFGV